MNSTVLEALLHTTACDRWRRQHGERAEHGTINRLMRLRYANSQFPREPVNLPQIPPASTQPWFTAFSPGELHLREAGHRSPSPGDLPGQERASSPSNSAEARDPAPGYSEQQEPGSGGVPWPVPSTDGEKMMRLSKRNSPYLMRDRLGSSALLKVSSKPRSGREASGETEAERTRLPEWKDRARFLDPTLTLKAPEEKRVRLPQVEVVQQHQSTGTAGQGRAEQQQQQPGERPSPGHGHPPAKAPSARTPEVSPPRPSNRRPRPCLTTRK